MILGYWKHTHDRTFSSPSPPSQLPLRPKPIPRSHEPLIPIILEYRIYRSLHDLHTGEGIILFRTEQGRIQHGATIELETWGENGINDPSAEARCLVIESLDKIGEIVFICPGILTSSSTMSNRGENRWIGLNSSCSCIAGLRLGFKREYFSNGFLNSPLPRIYLLGTKAELDERVFEYFSLFS